MGKRKDNTDVMKLHLAKLAKMKHLPILTLDSRWHMLFPEARKTQTIKKLEKKLNDLLKRQGKVIQDAKDLKKLKHSFMNDIVTNMQETGVAQNEQLRVKKLENSQKYIKEINDKLGGFDDELEKIPREIAEVNEQLMYESLRICYTDLHRNREVISAMDDWITKTRDKLKETMVQKQEMEQMNDNIYSYMHDMLGPEVIEVFDEDFKE